MQIAWENEIVHHMYLGWHTVIPWLLAQNSDIVFLSGTPRTLAQPLMDLFQIQHAICAEPEIIDQRYTGRLLKPHPKGVYKSLYAGQWLQSHGSDMQDATAIANAWPDRFLLSRTQPIVVRPGRRLNRYAQQHDWPVISNPDNGEQIIECIRKQWEKG